MTQRFSRCVEEERPQDSHLTSTWHHPTLSMAHERTGLQAVLCANLLYPVAHWASTDGAGDRGQWYKSWGLSYGVEGVVFTGFLAIFSTGRKIKDQKTKYQNQKHIYKKWGKLSGMLDLFWNFALCEMD